MNTTTLYRRTAFNITLKEALSWLDPNYTLLAYSATAFQILANLPEDDSTIFEARAFTREADVRWVRRSPEGGDGVLITEVAGKELEAHPGILDHNDLEYLVRPKAARTLSPDGKGDKNLVLKAREYLGEIDEFGNMAVKVERLIEFQSAAKRKGA